MDVNNKCSILIFFLFKNVMLISQLIKLIVEVNSYKSVLIN